MTNTLPGERLLASDSLFSLAGKVALVTGATGHLGRALAEALGEAGATVWLNGRSPSKVEEFANELRAAGCDAHPLPFDVTDAAATDAGIDEIAQAAGRLDVLVNNAHQPRSQSFTTATRDDFVDATRLAVAAAHGLTMTALPLLEQAANSSSPSVINIASMYGMVSPDPRMYATESMQNPPYYGQAKAGLLQWTRHAATHLGPRGIRVNAISPGPFPAAPPPTDSALFERLAGRVPLGRVGRPEELKTAVLFLASPASSFVTGVNIPVDGGWTIW